MKTVIFLSILLCAITAEAQDSSLTNNTWSASLGYGTQGWILRADARVMDVALVSPLPTGSLKAYVELGTKGISFSKSSFTFEHEDYPSNARLTVFGFGGGMEMRYQKFSIYPYLGFRYYYVRFTDQTLRDAIGSQGIQRYNGYDPVGPVVNNAYGDAFSIDLGGTLGYRITKVFEIGGLLGISPVSFNSAETLFGRYWGEAPELNPYYVQLHAIRAEIRARFNF